MIQSQIDFSRSERDKGIKKAHDSTEAVNPGWNEEAYKFLKIFIEHQEGTFMAEDVRNAGYLVLSRPNHDRSWGHVMRRAALEGLIMKVGIKSVKTPSNHMANATVWKKLKA